MKCPDCGCPFSRVKDSRLDYTCIVRVRRRECYDCKARWFTVEERAEANHWRVYRDGSDAKYKAKKG